MRVELEPEEHIVLVLDASDVVLNLPFAQLLSTASRITCWCDVKPIMAFEPLLNAFDEATVIVGYNILAFDLPLLKRYYKNNRNRYMAHRQKCHDLFDRIKSVVGFWPKLDHLLNDNALQSKTADGASAIAMWNDGRRMQLASYCMEDARLTLQLGLLPLLKIKRCGFTTIMEAFSFNIVCALHARMVSNVMLARDTSDLVPRPASPKPIPPTATKNIDDQDEQTDEHDNEVFVLV